MKRTYKVFNGFTNTVEEKEYTGNGENIALEAGIIDFENAEHYRNIIRSKHFQKFGFYPRSA